MAKLLLKWLKRVLTCCFDIGNYARRIKLLTNNDQDAFLVHFLTKFLVYHCVSLELLQSMLHHLQWYLAGNLKNYHSNFHKNLSSKYAIVSKNEANYEIHLIFYWKMLETHFEWTENAFLTWCVIILMYDQITWLIVFNHRNISSNQIILISKMILQKLKNNFNENYGPNRYWLNSFQSNTFNMNGNTKTIMDNDNIYSGISW